MALTFWKNIGQGFRNAGSEIGSGLAKTPFQLITHSATGLIDKAFAKLNMRYQSEINKGLMSHQAKLNQAAVDAQNAYNDPRSVSARARAAGLDPSVLLGGSPGSPGVSGASTGVSGSSVGSGGSSSRSQHFFANAMNAQQLKNLEAAENLSNKQADQAAAAADESRSRARNLDIDTSQKQWYFDNMNNIEKQIRSNVRDSSEAQAQIDKLNSAFESWKHAETPESSSKAKQEFEAILDNLKVNYGVKISEQNLNEAKVATEETQQDLNKAKTSTEETQQDLNKANESYTKALESYQSTVNESLKDFGLTPNSTVGGIVLGLGRTLINALGGPNQSTSEMLNNNISKLIRLIIDISPMGKAHESLQKAFNFVYSSFSSLPDEKKGEIAYKIYNSVASN